MMASIIKEIQMEMADEVFIVNCNKLAYYNFERPKSIDLTKLQGWIFPTRID